MTTLRGLDVSVCQSVIDWSKVPAEFRFVIIKASEGTGGQDPTRLRNFEGAKASGRIASYYHFCRPSQGAAAQLATLWKAIGDQMPDFRPVLDVESAPDAMTPRELGVWLLEAIETAEEYFGGPPLFYTYPWFEMSRIAAAIAAVPELGAALARCGLFMADYSKGEVPPAGASPVVPPPWKTWTFWQTSGNASSRVPGIPGAVDHDLFNGDEAALAVFRGLPTADQLEPDAPIIHPDVDFDPHDPEAA